MHHKVEDMKKMQLGSNEVLKTAGWRENRERQAVTIYCQKPKSYLFVLTRTKVISGSLGVVFCHELGLFFLRFCVVVLDVSLPPNHPNEIEWG